jgi:uncharacterized protein (DUF885 family)
VKASLTLAMALMVAACGPAERRDVPVPVREPTQDMLRDARAELATLRGGFLEWYHEANPVRASQLGIRAYDAQLPGMDRGSIQRRIDALLDWQSQLRQIPLRLMREGDRFDHALLDFAIRSELLQLEETRRWVVDPGLYTELIALAVSTVAEHPDAATAERAEALRSRLSGSPAVLAAARANLRTPPRPWTELGIEHGSLLLEYLDVELPSHLAGDAGWESERERIEAARLDLVAALRAHLDWLRTELLPVSTGDYRLGRFLLVRHLLYNEHTGVSLEEMDRLNEQNVALYREGMERAAAEIDPARPPRAVLDSLARVEIPATEVVATARAMMQEARDWVVTADLVSVPTQTLPVVRETPLHARQQETRLSSRGPLGGVATGAFYEVTPEPFSEGALLAATLHETFPGRYVHEQHARATPHDLRSTFLPRSLVAGWAHYAEQVSLDEGFRGGDPAVRVAQLRRALAAHARWYAALHLHGFNRPEAQVVERIGEMAYMDEAAARRVVSRVSYDPGAMAEAFGRVQILELRRAYEAHLEGSETPFTLREFHDRLLELSLPLPLATEALMPPPTTVTEQGRAGRVQRREW